MLTASWVWYKSHSMAKLPSLAELIKNPAKRRELTTPQLVEVLAALKALLPKEGGSEVPDDPATFAQQVSQGRWQRARHLDYIASQVVLAIRGLRPRVMISVPPRHGKSEFCSVWLPFWFLCKYPNKKVILASYGSDFAAMWGRRVRNLVTEYGSQFGLELDRSSRAVDEWTLTTGGGMKTAGMEGSITGRGAHLLIIDDAVKDEIEASSEIIRERAWSFWQTVALTRLEPGASVVVIGTRWHEDDLLARLEKASKSGDGLEWNVIKLPALAIEGDVLQREPDEPLWPERFDARALGETKKGMSPYYWSALYQQDPSPEEGGGVPRAWWRFYKVPPADFDQVIQSWDLSFDGKETHDFTVGQVWGRKGAQFYLLHQTRQRMSSVDVIAAIRAYTAMWPKALAKLIEKSANGPAVISMLQHEVPGMIPITPKGSKEARLEAVKPVINAGNVFLPENMDGTKPMWVWELIEECAAFPMSTHDDQVDALSQGLTHLTPGGWLEMSRAQAEATLPTLPHDPVEAQKAQFGAIIRKMRKEGDRKLMQRQQLSLPWRRH
jgi:predicted phage terminase large subunit-like protein